jgi:atypical dual specificity phosphatase
MSQPDNFSWIEKPLLAAMARPGSREELEWLRTQGIDILLSLTEEPPHRSWVNEAGLMLVHVPVEDLTAPSRDQMDQAMNVLARANEHGMGVGVHCAAGLGRTGVILACYFVTKHMTATAAIDHVRQLRPGSIETDEQLASVVEFARTRPDNP